MQIPEIFKKAIADTFYDKDIEIWSNTTTVDEEGAVIENGKLQKLDSFKGNFQFSTREYSRCRICGRPHAYLRKYGICRICFRELAYKGQIPGVKKASW